MAEIAKFLGWEISFKDETNNIEYGPEIVDFAIGQDVHSSIIMCSMRFSVDTSFSKYFSKQHDGKLTITNKTVITDEMDEMFIVDLQSVSDNGIICEREEDASRADRVTIGMQYMCKHGVKLMNKRVGGLFQKMKIEEIIQELYKKTECEIPLKIEKGNNTTKYEVVMVPESSFIDSIRYLNQKYGLYDNYFMMYGKTFTDEENEWVINCANKIKGEELELYLIPYEQSSRGIVSIEKKKYYTFQNISIVNNMSILKRKLPQVAQFSSFDNDKFMKRKDISIFKTLGELSTNICSDQFKKLDVPKQIFSGARFDMSEYSVKNAIQDIGLSTYEIPDIIIRPPFKLKHFQIGTTIQLKSLVQDYIDNDIKLLVEGWMLHIRQGNGYGGGASYSSELSLRTSAISYLNTEE